MHNSTSVESAPPKCQSQSVSKRSKRYFAPHEIKLGFDRTENTLVLHYQDKTICDVWANNVWSLWAWHETYEHNEWVNRHYGDTSNRVSNLFFAVNVTLPADLDFSVELIGSTEHFVVKDVMATVQPSRMYLHLTNLLSNDPLLGKNTSFTHRVVYRTLRNNSSSPPSSKEHNAFRRTSLYYDHSKALSTQYGKSVSVSTIPVIITTFLCHSKEIHFVCRNG